MDAEDRFQFIQQFQRRTCWPVKFVHEGENRDTPLAADLKKFARLGFDALAGVDNHHGCIHRREHAVGILREILMAGGIKKVDHAVAVVELQDG